jgi:hypothetical protein
MAEIEERGTKNHPRMKSSSDMSVLEQGSDFPGKFFIDRNVVICFIMMKKYGST